MKKILFIFCLFIIGVSAKSQVIKKSFKASVYVNDSTTRDTTLYVGYFFENDKIVEVHIDCINNDRDVKSAYFFCASNNVTHYYYLRQALIKALEKYKEWSIVARDNHVTDYKKSIEVDKKYLSFFIAYNHREKGTFTTMWSGIKYPTTDLDPVFYVTKGGLCYITLGVFGANAFRPKNIEGYVPSIWSQILSEINNKDKEKLSFHNALLRFFNSDNLQSFIDALDGDKVKLEYEEMAKERSKEKARKDALFK